MSVPVGLVPALVEKRRFELLSNFRSPPETFTAPVVPLNTPTFKFAAADVPTLRLPPLRLIVPVVPADPHRPRTSRRSQG